MKLSRSHIVAFALDLAVVVLEIWAITESGMRLGAWQFTYYTQLSNLLAGIVCACSLIARPLAARQGKRLPRALRLAKFVTCVCLLMTFLVVVFVLMPMMYASGLDGFTFLFLENSKPVTHFVAPALVLAGYLRFDVERDLTLRSSLIGLMPTLIYAAVAYPCNIARLWNGPYPFFQVYNYPLAMIIGLFVALLALVFGICQAVRVLGRAMSPIKPSGSTDSPQAPR